MDQENKELLLKDLCARLPYGVKVKLGDNPNIFDLQYRIKFAVMYGDSDKLEDILDITNIKPFLFPLSSMTEEQKRELLELTGYEPRCEESGGFDSWGFYVNIVGEYKYEDNQESTILYPYDIGIDWLNKNHFDYRGLIEKGLALDATGLDVY